MKLLTNDRKQTKTKKPSNKDKKYIQLTTGVEQTSELYYLNEKQEDGKIHLARFIFPQFITHIKTADKRKAKKKKKKLFNKDGTPKLDSKGRHMYKQIVTNPKTAGKERWEKISGQQVYSGGYGAFKQGKIIKMMKNYLIEAINNDINNNGIRPFADFPLLISSECHTVINHDTIRVVQANKLSVPVPKTDYKPRWDMDNLSYIWTKVFMDVLEELNFIPNDNIQYVAKPPAMMYCPVRNFEDRKLIFDFHVDPQVQKKYREFL